SVDPLRMYHEGNHLDGGLAGWGWLAGPLEEFSLGAALLDSHNHSNFCRPHPVGTSYPSSPAGREEAADGPRSDGLDPPIGGGRASPGQPARAPVVTQLQTRGHVPAPAAESLSQRVLRRLVGGLLGSGARLELFPPLSNTQEERRRKSARGLPTGPPSVRRL